MALWDTEIYDSARRRSPLVEEFLAIVRYRDLVAQWISHSVKTRYKRSFLGVAMVTHALGTSKEICDRQRGWRMVGRAAWALQRR